MDISYYDSLYAKADVSAVRNTITLLQTYTNTQIAATPNPFQCAGKVNGATSGNTLEIYSSRGRYGFTCTRVANQPTGAYYIQFNTQQTNSHYTIHLTNQATGHIKVWDTSIPTASGFHVIAFNTSDQVIFHFSVISYYYNT